MNEEIKAKHKLDEKHAEAVKELVKHPLDLPSLERQMWHSCDMGDEPFLSDGYQWTDKPHRVLSSAISEIRALRAFIAKIPAPALPLQNKLK